MSSVYDDVLSLSPGKESWRILVKVIRLWYGQSFNSGRLPSSLELVVIDSQGTKIHVFIKKTLMYKFERLVSDGQVFSISCFEVAENTGMFKPAKHDFKINLHLKSEVRPMNQFPITADPFTFVPLFEVISPNFDTSYLIDVIGILTGYGTEREIVTNGRKVKMNVIEIDSVGVKMECAFFGSYNEQLNIFLRHGDMVNVVIILQFVKVKNFQGTISLQNVHGATKILFNPVVAMTESVRQRYSECNSTGSQTPSQLQDSSKGTGDEEFLILTPRKSVAEINDSKEDGCFVICATVSYVELGHDWWYTACKCNRKVYPDEKMYFCESCNRHVVSVCPRYRLQLMVHDDSACASIVLFDKEATALIGKPCSDLVEMNGTSNELPKEIQALMDQKYLFKLELKTGAYTSLNTCKFGPSHKVKRVCTDSSVIEQFVTAQIENNVRTRLPYFCYSYIHNASPYINRYGIKVGITSSRLLSTPSNALASAEVTKDLLEDFVVVSTEKNPSTPDFVTIDLNDNTQEILCKRGTSPEEVGGSCNLKKKKVPALRLKKEK